ncbi:hypothetical protein H0H92_005837 [Tricholoma furcatifolium]|nr:hypothetical protein H0H92_005837 [Tricholoma furcatifolium]
MTIWSPYSRDPGHSVISRWTQEVDISSLNPSGEKTASYNPEMPSPVALPLPVVAKTPTQSSSRRPKKSLSRTLWTKFKRRVGSGSAPSPSSSSAIDDTTETHVVQMVDMPVVTDDEVTDKVVVDRVWSEDITSSTSHSENALSPEKSGGSQHAGRSASDHESVVAYGFWSVMSLTVLIRWRMWPLVVKFFSSSFSDPKSEAHYAQENWFTKKSLASWASVWLILNWVLGCIFSRPLYQTFDQIFYFAVRLASLIMVIYDWPRDRSNIYQTFLTLSAVLFGAIHLSLSILSPGTTRSPELPGPGFSRDILLYNVSDNQALQVVGLFGLKMNRLPAAIGAGTFFVMRLFTLRDQLKVQFKATQKAQINERKAAESKRRLTSYVFHDKYLLFLMCVLPIFLCVITVLAVQNMEASGTVAKEQEIEFSALEGSLNIVVLNDVLDFNRMDSGNFESVSLPYAFHHVMRSLFVPLRLTTDARGLEFETELDPRIDQIARHAAYKATGESDEAIRRHICDHPDLEGIVTGDEARLRQIITNLASNACKFTPDGGKLSIKTKLVWPAISDNSFLSPVSSSPSDCPYQDFQSNGHPPLSASHLSQHNNEPPGKRLGLDYIVVRIEVTDTGFGISPRDLMNNKLFYAWNQTEQGRQQGGKGTGLGLALVRQIVKLSGGRLGVRSKLDEGSTFWVELPLGIGTKALTDGQPPKSSSEDATISSDLNAIGAPVEIRSMDAHASVVDPVVPSTSLDFGRSNAAMQGLMEQGGRVELFLQRQGSRSPGLISSDARSSYEDRPQPIDDSNQVQPPPPEKTIEPKATRPRPTYVPMPSPQSFHMDTHPTNASNCSNTSAGSKISDPLAQFDAAHARRSPSLNTPPLLFDPALPVLVVDDDPLTRTLMRRLLSRLGCQVSLAENGEVALEMILAASGSNALTPSSDGSSGPILEKRPECHCPEKSRYAVVFLDNQMPVLSGLQAVQRVRSCGRTDFIVGVTGNALKADQDEYLQAGVDLVLTKPVLERNLRDILVVAHERRKQLSYDMPP